MLGLKNVLTMDFFTKNGLLTICFLVFFIPSLNAQNNKYLNYIEKHKHLAIAEMHLSGIPASIKLAQGLLETGAGESYLCTNANNHFAIKCKVDWRGETILANDDAVGECFRKYPTTEASYRDHSNFLKYHRLHFYDELFKLAPNDYVGWARGLKKAGYATVTDYAERLINVVKKYKLYQYDSAPAPSQEMLMVQGNVKTIGSFNQNYQPNKQYVKRTQYPTPNSHINRPKNYLQAADEQQKIKNQSVQIASANYIADNSTYSNIVTGAPTYQNAPDFSKMVQNSGSRYQISTSQQSQKNMSVKIGKKQAKSYVNTGKSTENTIIRNLPKNEPRRILKPAYKYDENNFLYHLVEEGDTMEKIAEWNKTDLEKLYRYNKLVFGQQPAVGEKIYIRAMAKETPKLKNVNY